MKKYSLLLLLVMVTSITNSLVAQKKRVYLFENFTNGKVLMTNRSTIAAELNYDASNKKMMYKDNGEEMILVNTQMIDTVFVGTQKFIPIGRIFLEVTSVPNGNVYINWELKEINKGKQGLYGHTSSSTNVTSIDPGHFNYSTDQYRSPEVIKSMNQNEYWVQRNGSFIKFKNKKSLLKVFSGKEEEIENYIKQHKIDIKDPAHMVQLANFCIGL